MSNRLLRSVMYLPASNAKMVEKAALHLKSCDGFIFDMEDAVPRDAKEQARLGAQHAISLMRTQSTHQTCVVRVNGINTPWFEQDCLAAQNAHAVLLPKAESPSELDRVRALVGPTPELWAMLETPLGVLNAAQLAQKASVLVMGTVDLANELQCSVDPQCKRSPLQTALSMCVLAAKAHRVQILDGVFVHLKDAEGFKAECRQGLELGFTGKTLIHPNTIDVCNQIFSPTEEELRHAEKICALYKESSLGGAILLDGKLVEELHIRRALQLMEFAQQIRAARGGE